MIRDLIPTLILREMKKLNAYRKFRNLKPYVSQIRKLKNSYSGKVLLLGSGSSVNDFDLEGIDNIDIIFMNNWHAHPSYTRIITNNNNIFHVVAPVHGPASRSYWKDWLKKIISNCKVNYILGINDYIDSSHKLVDNNNKNIYYYAPLLDRRIDIFHVNDKNYNLDNPIYGAGAVSVYALLLACYLGYEDIYLLGVDHSHLNHINTKNKGRFYNTSGHTDLEQTPTMEKIFVNQGNTFLQYRYIRDRHPDKNFINLGGEKSIVDTFQRQDFEDVFN